uniref:Uncharacterized protein n=1 Tax=Meloidogyne javanica TaxID=6303 RepID=A0A915LH54_MELJA
MAESEIDNDNSIFDVNETEEITIVNQSKLDLAEPAHSFLRYYSYVRERRYSTDSPDANFPKNTHNGDHDDLLSAFLAPTVMEFEDEFDSGNSSSQKS